MMAAIAGSLLAPRRSALGRSDHTQAPDRQETTHGLDRRSTSSHQREGVPLMPLDRQGITSRAWNGRPPSPVRSPVACLLPDPRAHRHDHGLQHVLPSPAGAAGASFSAQHPAAHARRARAAAANEQHQHSVFRPNPGTDAGEFPPATPLSDR